MKVFIIIFFCIIFFSCATVHEKIGKIKYPKRKSLYEILNKKFPKSENPNNFKKNIPTSPIFNNSVICFKKKIPQIILSNNIIDFAYDNYSDTLFILHKNKIETSKYFCPEILIDKKNPIKIYANKGKIAVEFFKFINIYSLNYCGKILSFEKSKPFFSFNGDYYALYNRENFEIYKVGKDFPYLFGKLSYIKCVKFENNLLKVIGRKKNIVADLIHKKFLPPDNSTFCTKNKIVKLKDISIFKKNKTLFARKIKKIYYKTIYFNGLKFLHLKSKKILRNKNVLVYKFILDNSSTCFLIKIKSKE